LFVVVCLTSIDGAPPLPGDRPGWRRFQTPPIEGTLHIGELFTMSRPSLAAIDIRPVAVGPVRGRIRLALRTAGDGVTPVDIRSAEVDAADVVRNGAYRFEFAPVHDSAGRRYRLEISSSAESPSSGVALWATKGDRLEDATLMVNGMERWAELAFQTHSATVPPPPAWLNGRHPLVQLTYAVLVLIWLGVLYAIGQLPRYHPSPHGGRA
jgi:hypothetical protein